MVWVCFRDFGVVLLGIMGLSLFFFFRFEEIFLVELRKGICVGFFEDLRFIVSEG